MSPEVLRHVGEPFFTTKQPGAGMGLGLFLAGRVIERLGGEPDLPIGVGRANHRRRPDSAGELAGDAAPLRTGPRDRQAAV